MQCASCGTQNAPDSRFCGGCGKRLAMPSRPLVAPTARISDPALPVVPAAVTPTHAQTASAESSNASHMSEAVPSFAPGRPRRAVIALVVAFDICLAVAGSALLTKGLARPSGEQTTPSVAEPKAEAVSAEEKPVAPVADRDEQTTAPPPSEPVPPAPPRPSKTRPAPAPSTSRKSTRPIAKKAAAKSAANGAAAPAATRSTALASTSPAATAKIPAAPAKAPADTTPPPAPRDPMQSLASEVELATTRTRPQFDRCYFGAGGANAVHGVITIAFQVTSEGRADHVTAVVNTTGSATLAACLVAQIAQWRFAASPEHSATFTRTFNYS